MRHWTLPSVPPQMSGGAVLPTDHQDLAVAIDSGINLICHCSYEVLWNYCCSTCQSVGTIHNRLQGAAQKASAIITQDLSAIQVGLHDEIFQEVSLY